ncbi:50S ribosomal protein L20 [candidate division TA06 bacterium DG_26]|uniref:Large ribosomal subunit protein bL20 n=1 Tax=candidate division TA06 bacterium DG_26 TaxID=1703771 RepID=A0A0S7WHX6_UNCT6|nr:MAG: 50S ribosomal protein L20 [candidate division TA06 bacterium DG_26]
MPRVRSTPATRQRRKKWLKQAKGYWGRRSTLYKKAREAVMKAWADAYKDRRRRKREMRKLWIIRINARAREYGLPYGKFMEGLRRSGVQINRKMLADLAIRDAQSFESLVKTAKDSLNN